jgi:hypothetical protein
VKGEHPCGDMGHIITFSFNNFKYCMCKNILHYIFYANYVFCKKLFLNTGIFYEVFGALWQVMNMEFNGYPLHLLKVCVIMLGLM